MSGYESKSVNNRSSLVPLVEVFLAHFLRNERPKSVKVDGCFIDLAVSIGLNLCIPFIHGSNAYRLCRSNQGGLSKKLARR